MATLRYGTGPFQEFVGKPLLMTPGEAVEELMKARAQARGRMAAFLLEDAMKAIGEAGCPSCRGTGFSFEMRQLTPEEAEKLR